MGSPDENCLILMKLSCFYISSPDPHRRFKVLQELYAPSFRKMSAVEACTEILSRVGVTGWARGHSKILLKFHHTSQLEAHSSSTHKKVMTIQRSE